MSGPNRIRLKRRRDELPPNQLVVEERRQKRTLTESLYIRQDDANRASGTTTPVSQLGPQPPAQTPSTPAAAGTGVSQAVRRFFHLSRITGKRKGRDEGFATVVEKRENNKAPLVAVDDDGNTDVVETPLKRPSRRAAIKTQPKEKEPEVLSEDKRKEQDQLESIGNELHNFALEELAREPPKPRPMATPKLAGSRSREIHRQRTVAAPPRIHDEDADMEDENGAFVYDTYILAGIPSSSGDANVNSHGDSGDIGYVIITEEDQEIWEHYIEDEPSDKDWDTDEDDENAEGYYAADYPDDELASDDEHDRDAYRYRHHGGSDDEEYDEDTGAFSDEDEDDFMGKNWRNKTPAQFVTHLKQKDATD